jgi:hypothetical protein
MGGARPPLGWRMGIDHFVQAMCCILNVEVFVLARPAFSGNHAATVDVPEVSVGKFISSFGILGSLVINSQMPFPVFFDPMAFDKVILLLRGWLVFAPRISLVKDKPSIIDELFRMIECFPIQFHGHDVYSSSTAMFLTSMLVSPRRDSETCGLCQRLDPPQFTQRRDAGLELLLTRDNAPTSSSQNVRFMGAAAAPLRCAS